MEILCNGHEGPVLILAHGSGAPMDSGPMERLARALAGAGFRVRRFEFPFMRERRSGGKRRPPDRQPVLLAAWQQAIKTVQADEPDARQCWVGGRSLGGRMASLLLTPENRATEAAGALAFGYPFHPPRKPEQWRTGHFSDLCRPLWIAQGERDPFGKRVEVEAQMPFADRVHVEWVNDGDHELMPTRRSKRDPDQLLEGTAARARAFVRATEANDD